VLLEICKWKSKLKKIRQNEDFGWKKKREMKVNFSFQYKWERNIFKITFMLDGRTFPLLFSKWMGKHLAGNKCTEQNDS